MARAGFRAALYRFRGSRRSYGQRREQGGASLARSAEALVLVQVSRFSYILSVIQPRMNADDLKFSFDVRKTVAASAYLTQKAGGSISPFFLIKMLYRADRSALIQWGRTLTGDTYYSMRSGPVLSAVYDLLKGNEARPELKIWQRYFTPRANNVIKLRATPRADYLSQREKEVLDLAFREIVGVRGRISDWMHKSCPEWKDPGQGHAPLSPNEILRFAGKSDADIAGLAEEVDAISWVKHAFS